MGIFVQYSFIQKGSICPQNLEKLGRLFHLFVSRNMQRSMYWFIAFLQVVARRFVHVTLTARLSSVPRQQTPTKWSPFTRKTTLSSTSPIDEDPFANSKVIRIESFESRLWNQYFFYRLSWWSIVANVSRWFSLYKECRIEEKHWPILSIRCVSEPD